MVSAKKISPFKPTIVYVALVDRPPCNLAGIVVVNHTHLLEVMLLRLSQNIGLLDLTNRNRFKKGNGYKIRTKGVHDYWGRKLHT